MTELTPPYLLSEDGDVDVFPTLEAMSSYVEVYDLDRYEFFDSVGCCLTASADGYQVVIAPNPDGRADPDHLEDLLRTYFLRLSSTFKPYVERAQRAETLAELVKLRSQFEEEGERKRNSRSLPFLRWRSPKGSQ